MDQATEDFSDKLMKAGASLNQIVKSEHQLKQQGLKHFTKKNS